LNESEFTDNDLEGDVIVQEEKPKLKKPPLYRVIILNDDYTPMEFVVHVLEHLFGMDFDKAWRLMMTIHTIGQGTVGIYPFEIAETKSERVNSYSRENDHPLLSTIEKTD